MISEKLYGREQAVETLLTGFRRVMDGTKEIILVVGFSGIGKTAVINEFHKMIGKQYSSNEKILFPYFIRGKFDQFKRDIPLSGLVQAFRDLTGQILSESDAKIEQWRD